MESAHAADSGECRIWILLIENRHGRINLHQLIVPCPAYLSDLFFEYRKVNSEQQDEA